MSIFSFLNSGTKAAENVTDIANKGISLIDNAFFTEQEKSKATLDIMDAYIKGIKTVNEESSVRSVTRRYVALSFIAQFLITFNVGIVLIILEKTAMLENLIKWSSSLYLGWIILTIVVFYFGYYGFKQIKKESN